MSPRQGRTTCEAIVHAKDPWLRGEDPLWALKPASFKIGRRTKPVGRTSIKLAHFSEPRPDKHSTVNAFPRSKTPGRPVPECQLRSCEPAPPGTTDPNGYTASIPLRAAEW